MSLIRYPANDNRKTSSSEVDQQFSQKVTAVKWLSFIDAEGISRNIVDGTTLEYTSSTVISDEGPVSQFNGSQQGRVLLPSLLGEDTGRGLLVCARIKATAVQPNSHGCAFGVFNDGGPSQFGFGVGYDTANNIGASVLHGNAAALTARSPALQDKWYTVFVRCLSVGTGYNLYAWIDGVPATIDQGVAQTGGNGPLTEVAIGAQHRSTGYLRFFIGQVAWAAVLNVVEDFNDQDALELFNSGFPFSAISNEKGYTLNVDPYLDPQKAKIRYAPVRNKQPSSSVGIDWTNPLSFGLVAALPASRMDSDAVAGLPVDSTGTNTTAVNVNGIARKYENAGLRWEITPSSLESGVTLLTVSVARSTSQIDLGVSVFSSDDIFYPSYETGAFRLFRRNNNGFPNAAFTTALQTGKSYVVAGVQRNSALRELYVDGALVATNTTDVPRSHVFYRVGTNYGETGVQPASFFPATYEGPNLYLVWNRALSSREIEEISANPWQVFDAAEYTVNVEPYVEPGPSTLAKYRKERDFWPVKQRLLANKNHPAMQGMTAGWRFEEGTVDGLMYDFVRGTTVSTSTEFAGPIAPFRTAHGVGMLEPANGGASQPLASSDSNRPITAFATFVVVDGTVNSTSKLLLFSFDRGSSFDASGANIYAYWFNNGTQRTVGVKAVGNNTTVEITDVPDGLHTIAASVGVHPEGLGLKVIFDGRVVSFTSFGSIFYNDTLAVSTFQSPTFSSSGAGYVLMRGFYRGATTNEKPRVEEVLELSKNPWAMFGDKEYYVPLVTQSEGIPFPIAKVRKASKQPAKYFGLPKESTGVRAPIAVTVPAFGDTGLTIANGRYESVVTRNGTGVFVADTREGRGFVSNGNSKNSFRLHSVANQFDTVWERPSTQLTAFVYLMKYGDAAGNSPLFSNGSANTGPFSAYNILHDQSGGGRIAVEMATTGFSYQFIGGNFLPSFVPTTVALVYNGSSAQLYQDGLQTATLNASGTIVYPNATDRGPSIGNFWNFTGNNRSFNGEIYCVALWDEALTPNEIQKLHADPWGSLLESKNAYVPYGTSGILIPILLALAPTNVSLSTFRPRYQLTY